MREAAIQAGLVQSAGAKGVDKNWRDRLRIITCVITLFSAIDN